jgi:uncharacterized hydrophobic protein (TIGR00341 family)
VPYRLVQIVVPERAAPHVRKLLQEREDAGSWESSVDGERSQTFVMVRAEQVESLLDELDARFSHEPEFRAAVAPLQAMLPREQEEPAGEPERQEPAAAAWRLSREELHQSISESARVTPIFVALVVVSTIVAAVGLLQGNVAVVIGAMVIAPLLGPNLALALATILWDRSLLRLATLANGLGVGLALVVAAGIGRVVGADPSLPEIASRTSVGYGDVVLGLAAGVAGALSFTSGAPASLIGVMVAVALLPPLTAAGLLAGAGHTDAASGAALLTAANVICVNLAAMLTFLAQGLRPRRWWQRERAARAARAALALWVTLLLALLGSILLRELR